ncbi:MAG: hypothetical protein KGJ84_15560 [Elusimicrobia bacterium]|nr:hypothetical protein [Elusimicrobiota bacterium]
MKYPGLVSVLASLALLPGGPVRAQPAPDSRTEAAFAAGDTLRRLDAALAPLEKGDYQSKDRRAVLPVLVLLQKQLAAARPAGAEASTERGAIWGKLVRAADESVTRESHFWTGIPEPDRPQGLPGETAKPLRLDAKRLGELYDLLYPRPKGAAQNAGGGRPRESAALQRASQSAATVARLKARGAQAVGNPDHFYDGGAARGAESAVAAGAPSAPRKNDSALPIEPVQRLRTNSVPPPNGEELACRKAAGGGLFAGTCGWKMGKSIGPLAAGVVDAFKDQFGTTKGLVMNLVFLAGGLLLGAMTGGAGALVKFASIVRALCTLAVIGTALALIYQLYEAVKAIFATSNDDPRHWQAIRKVGAIGGQVMAVALMAFIGYKITVKPPDEAAVGAMTEALASKAGGEGAGSAAQMRAALHEPAPAPAPKAAEPEAIPRSPKSKLQFSEQTLRRNAAIKDPQVRIEEAMRQLKVDRAFAEKVAKAHDDVPCPVGGCTPAQLRAKLKIMGPGPESRAAIRSGLAGEPPPEGAPALDGAPKGAPFHDANGKYLARTEGATAPKPLVVVEEAAGESVGDHFFEDGDLKAVKTPNNNKPIVGAHASRLFAQALARRNGVIVSEAPVPELEGVSLVKYQYYAKAADGTISNILKSKIFAKTVFDEGVWSPAKITQLAKSVFKGVSYRVLDSGSAVAEVEHGKLKFTARVDPATGNITTFGIDILP